MEKKIQAIFFALEKHNRKRNNITCLKINNETICNSKIISEYVYTFYNNIYKSKNKEAECESFTNSVHSIIPTISDRYKQNCENAIRKKEMDEAIKSMQKNKSPGCDGLTVEFMYISGKLSKTLYLGYIIVV